NIRAGKMEQRGAAPDPVEVAVRKVERAEVRLAELNPGHAPPRFGEHAGGQVDSGHLKAALVKPLAVSPGPSACVENAKTVGRAVFDDCPGELFALGVEREVEVPLGKGARDAVVGPDRLIHDAARSTVSGRLSRIRLRK